MEPARQYAYGAPRTRWRTAVSSTSGVWHPYGHHGVHRRTGVADSAVYAIFQGTSFKEIGQSIQQGESLQDGGRYLYVFSLTGAPLRCYVLDRHVCGIAVNEKRRILWTTDVNSDEPVVEFRLDATD